MKNELREIMNAALAAAEPGRTIRRSLSVEDGCVKAGGETFKPRRVFVLAVGKAAGPMARASGEVLREVLSGGLCVIKEGHEEPPEYFEAIVAFHPGPAQRGGR